VKKSWKVFNGESYDEDPDLHVNLLDPASLPDVELEVDPPSASGGKPGRPAGAHAQPSRACPEGLPEDAPPEHISHQKIKYEGAHCRVVFYWAASTGPKIPFQVTVNAAGTRDNAEVIARACYVKFEEGLTKEQVQAFRKDCYDRLKSPKTSTSAPSFSRAASAVAEDDPHDHKKRRREKEDEEKKDQNEALTSPAPAAHNPQAESDEESSSSSSSSASEGEDGKERKAAAKGAKAPAASPSHPTGPLGRLGRVAAKMSVRTGFRCWCCYEKTCLREKGGSAEKA